MITFICDASAEAHLIANMKAFSPKSLTLSVDLSGDNRIKAEIIVSSKDLHKAIDYLKQNYVKQYNGTLAYVTDYFTA